MQSVISWNVLYRAYEEEYYPDSTILKTYPKEEDRVNGIITLIQNKANNDTVICLQECSSTICEKLATAFAETHRVFAYNIRNDEHLVTVAPKEFKMIRGGSHETSNGYLAVHNGPVTIINCHLLPRRYAKSSVMKHLQGFLDKYPGIVFIAGDFNEIHKKVKEKLGEYYVCPYYGKTYKNKPIDHIVFTMDDAKYKTTLIKQDQLSDHHAIALDFEL
jgi:hypothetical protein